MKASWWSQQKPMNIYTNEKEKRFKNITIKIINFLKKAVKEEQRNKGTTK